jgi:hypothetical protein
MAALGRSCDFAKYAICGGFNWSTQHFNLFWKDGVNIMKYRRRVFFTDKQKSEIWDRWQRGESMSSIGRGFDRASSSIYPLLARTGGIRPRDRIRSRLALTLTDREEISRGLRAQMSLRSIARTLKRSAAKLGAMEAFKITVRRRQIRRLGTVLIAQNPVSWQAMAISAHCPAAHACMCERGRYRPN